ncbi:disulfide bond formation protein B [Actibacterium pelagium]|uniref:Dihydroneopterin aldolase n=1 Tax=Actibacterium pelagium TaxID=2029103 RepID=A0A917EIZ7_9RHOB|nr:disulfide bond formation protein B [Actibacterium pelagium]GGE42500.1 dihydroneopterin aldolase [Actibacterium pelagium]
MTQQQKIFLAALGSAALLLGAFGFQYIGGLAPCKLCLWQRWPHAAAILIGAVALLTQRGQLAFLGAAAALTTGGIGVYHTGVERGWWEGPTSCTGDASSLSGMTGGDLLDFSAPETIIMCDEVVWEMLGLSMASWNAVAAFGLAALWIWAAITPEKH